MVPRERQEPSGGKGPAEGDGPSRPGDRSGPREPAEGRPSPPALLSLDALYRWFQEEVVRPNEAPSRPGASGRLPVAGVITPSATLAADERLGIYVSSYFLRLHEVLAEDFETVRALAGVETFEDLARRYLTLYPSRSPSLNHLGLSFPRFLGEALDAPRHGLLRDVAEVELAMSLAVDDAEAPSLTAEELARRPLEAWGRARLPVLPSLRTFRLEHDVNPIINAVKRHAPLPPLDPRLTHVAVYRLRFVVTRLDLTALEHKLLSELAGGATLLEALGRAAEGSTGAQEGLPDEVYRAFAKLAGEGLFRAGEREGQAGGD